MDAYVLKQADGSYRCHNLHLADEAYHRNVINAVMVSNKAEAEYWSNSLNTYNDDDNYSVVSITIFESKEQ